MHGCKFCFSPPQHYHYPVRAQPSHQAQGGRGSGASSTLLCSEACTARQGPPPPSARLHRAGTGAVVRYIRSYKAPTNKNKGRQRGPLHQMMGATFPGRRRASRSSARQTQHTKGGGGTQPPRAVLQGSRRASTAPPLPTAPRRAGGAWEGAREKYWGAGQGSPRV